MKTFNYPEKRFYFSTTGTMVGSIVLILFLVAFFYIGVRLVQVSLFGSIFVLVIAIFCSYLTLPDLYGNIQHLNKKEPALILTDETLRDNTSDLECGWTDIKVIKEGDSDIESDSGYIIIKMKAHDIPNRISPMVIRAKRGVVLKELKRYHLNAIVKANNYSY